MNFLAHLALSGDDHEVMVGNFIGDFVKGNSYQNYPPKIQKGILMHRTIDYFTDRHQSTKICSQLLYEGYGRYSGVVVDVFFDHFLAENWNSFYTDITLHQFVTKAHKILLKHYFTLPGEVKGFLPFLINSRRLENYRHFDSLERSLEIMSNRTSLPSHVPFAIATLKDNYDLFRDNFFILYNDLQQHLNISNNQQ